MSIEVNPVYLAPVILVWLLIYHVAYAMTAVLRDRSLVCWSVGPLGINVVALRKPPARQVLTQLACGSVAVALAAYASLYALQPGPVRGLGRTLPQVVVAVALPVVVLTFARLIGILRDQRFPIWGEARVLTRVQRSLATGALIVFTASGRAFLRERFGASPGEFLRMVRS